MATAIRTLPSLGSSRVANRGCPANPSSFPSSLHPRAARPGGAPVNRAYRTVPVRALSGPQTLTLPNGLTCAYASLLDVEFLYREVYERRSYLQHGLHLAAGDTVLDVGANIGFFAMTAAEEVGAEGRVVCMEPIPWTHAALVQNMELHRRWRDDTGEMPPARVVALECGVGDGSQSTAEFTAYPKYSDTLDKGLLGGCGAVCCFFLKVVSVCAVRAAGWSTMRPDPQGVVNDMIRFLDSSLSAADVGIPDTWLVRLARVVQRWAPWLVRLAVWLYVRAMMLGSKEVLRCSLKSVSQVIAEQSLSTVNLLKIDVERAELDALRGISPQDWPRIQQLVMEVHNRDDALSEIKKILQGVAGFSSITVVQDDALRGTDLFNVYCTRY